MGIFTKKKPAPTANQSRPPAPVELPNSPQQQENQPTDEASMFSGMDLGGQPDQEPSMFGLVGFQLIC